MPMYVQLIAMGNSSNIVWVRARQMIFKYNFNLSCVIICFSFSFEYT